MVISPRVLFSPDHFSINCAPWQYKKRSPDFSPSGALVQVKLYSIISYPQSSFKYSHLSETQLMIALARPVRLLSLRLKSAE